jgi:hypothetical protein
VGIVAFQLAANYSVVQFAKIVKNTVPTKSVGNLVSAGSQAIDLALEPLPYGSYGFSADELVWVDAATRDQQLEDMKAAGASWVRIDMQWYVVQPSDANTYDWTVYDRAIDAINKHNLRPLVILDYAPAWAAIAGCRPTSRHKCAPADPHVFATYASAAAVRYTKHGVVSWEIWNEPNSPVFWFPRVDAGAYANLLKAAYPAIKKVSPNSTIVTAGLRAATSSGDISPHDYVAALYDSGAQPYFDAIGAHPYSYPALPLEMSDRNGWTQMLAVRDIAVAHGDAGKKIWMTEVGASTGGPHPITEYRQTQIVDQVTSLHNSYDWAGPLFWYDYKDLGTDRSTGHNFFGLVRRDGSHKSAYDSYLRAAK